MPDKKIIHQIRKANQQLIEMGLVKLTFGNVSGRINKGTIGIKPSGVLFSELKDRDIVLLDFKGKYKSKGSLMPSVDTPVHMKLYEAFPLVNAIIHTHSPYATAFAQAKIPIKCFGTTHADYFYGQVPISRELSEDEIKTDYETNIGIAIAETFLEKKLDYQKMPACLVPGHGSFVWGPSVREAMENALVLEEIAKMAVSTICINPNSSEISSFLLDKHFLRKHGKEKYYGQVKKI